MMPLGGEGVSRELDLGSCVAEWNRRTLPGRIFSSQVVFRRPSGALRGPDASTAGLARPSAPARRHRLVPLFFTKISRLGHGRRRRTV
jgi:hypothetical protein